MSGPRTFQYGSSADQDAYLYLPSTPKPPVGCLLHGGFWLMPHGRGQMEAVASDLVWHVNTDPRAGSLCLTVPPAKAQNLDA